MKSFSFILGIALATVLGMGEKRDSYHKEVPLTQLDLLRYRTDLITLRSLDQCIQVTRLKHLDPHIYCQLSLIVPDTSY